jgi:hypothetical protein
MRNTTKLFSAFAAVLFLVPVSDALAQRRRGLVDVSPESERHGAWLSFYLGAGSENYRYSNVPGGYNRDDNVQPSFAISAGGTVNPHLRLGGEINGWVYSHNDNSTGFHVTDYLVGGLLTGQVFPARQLGLFLKGGLGISRSGEDISGGIGVGETGFAYLYGAGYEIKLARNFFLTPAVNLLYHRSRLRPEDDPDNLGALHERVITLGVGLTFQPGR